MALSCHLFFSYGCCPNPSIDLSIGESPAGNYQSRKAVLAGIRSGDIKGQDLIPPEKAARPFGTIATQRRMICRQQVQSLI